MGFVLGGKQLNSIGHASTDFDPSIDWMAFMLPRIPSIAASALIKNARGASRGACSGVSASAVEVIGGLVVENHRHF